MLLTRVACSLLCVAVLPAAAAAQAEQIASGVHAVAAHDLAGARRDFEAALHRDPNSYEANWRMSLLLIDVAKQVPDHIKSPTRDSLYQLAESYARRAVAVRGDDTEGHFALANAIGRSLLSMSAREKVRRATEVHTEALRAVELDPRNDGAWHILGRWNAEVERLSAFERLVARTFLGGKALAGASWDEAERDLRIAVELAPARIVHRLDLAEILVSRQKWAAAKQQLDEAETLPPVDISDPMYKQQARALEVKVLEKLHK
ncbi:MAG TPA: hypothetical protein VGM77_08000 [Gemmatimonadales bacterium]